MLAILFIIFKFSCRNSRALTLYKYINFRKTYTVYWVDIAILGRFNNIYTISKYLSSMIK